MPGANHGFERSTLDEGRKGDRCVVLARTSPNAIVLVRSTVFAR